MGKPFLRKVRTRHGKLSGNFDRLELFANKVSQILLEGNGQYLDDDEKILQKHCNKRILGRYYHSEADTMKIKDSIGKPLYEN